MVALHKIGVCPGDDVNLSFRLFGRNGGTPLLFVHGLSYFSYDWVDIGSRLAGDRMGCAVDMRGFGDSSSSAARNYKIPAMAADLQAVLDHLAWPRAIVFGHSMGGRSAAYLANSRPDRVAGLVLVDYSPENAPEGSKRVANTVANTPDVFASVDEAMHYFGADPHSPQNAGKRERYTAYLRPVPGGFAIKRDAYFREQFRKQLATGERPAMGVDMWQILKDLQVPTLVVRGTHSDMFAAETAAKVKAANARITLLQVKAGHNIAGENPDGFFDAVRPFIDSIDGASHDKAD